MLAFDIETMGLKAGRDDITIVCTEDFFTGQKIAYEFRKLKIAGDIDGYERRKEICLKPLIQLAAFVLSME